MPPTGIDANQSVDWTLILPYLDKTNELTGIRVVFYDGYKMHVERKGPPTIGRDARAVVIKPDGGARLVWKGRSRRRHQ